MSTQHPFGSNTPIDFHELSGNALLRENGGEFINTIAVRDLGRVAVCLANGSDEGSWVSPVITPKTAFDTLIPSWQASTPRDTYIETHAQVQLPNGVWSKWFKMGRWAFHYTVDEKRTLRSLQTERKSFDAQKDAIGSVDQDTLTLTSPAKAYRLRALLRRTGAASPKIWQLAASTSDTTGVIIGETSPTTLKGLTIARDVPCLSQYAHLDEYLELDGGGRAWCSPTAVAMVLRSWGVHLKDGDIRLDNLPKDLVFDTNRRAMGDVNYAALHTFDSGAGNVTGNWPFNTAFAAEMGLDASVRQYNSLRDVEEWINKNVPVIAAIHWGNDSPDPSQHLTGTYIKRSAGHLLVVVGFTEKGDVVVNDPAAPTNESVRRVYNRAQFERRWLETKGVVYIIKPEAIR